jgi:hypothetical protein
VFVLNFYSPVFIDQLKRGRKTATIRLGDKSKKYRKGEVVMITVGFQHSPRERIFEAVIDSVDVKRVDELSRRDIEHDNPEFRRLDEMVHFLEQIYGRKVGMEDLVTVVRFSQIAEHRSEISERMRPDAFSQN